MSPMAFWKRRRETRSAAGERISTPDDARRHLEAFVTSRTGVEAYVEPSTNVTATTLVLVAHDGEWTRRAIRSRDEAFDVARALGLPTYDVLATGYPQRMRDWTSRQRRTDS